MPNKKKASPKKPTKKRKLARLPNASEVEELKQGDFEHRAQILETRSVAAGKSRGVQVITINNKKGYPDVKQGLWLSQKIDVKAFFQWLTRYLKKVSLKVWGKNINLDSEQVKLQREEVDHLKKQLVEKQAQLEDAEAQLAHKERFKRLAGQVPGSVDTYTSAINELKRLVRKSKVEDKRMENEVRDFIAENKWVLGLDCEIGAKEQPIDVSHTLDLHIITDQGQDRVFEFKSPNLMPFKHGKKKGARPEITLTLADGINQLIQYLRQTNLYSWINSPENYGVYSASGVVVMGFKLDKEDLNLIKDWNRHLYPHVQIVTFDELIASAKKQLDIIKKAKEESGKI